MHKKKVQMLALFLATTLAAQSVAGSIFPTTVYAAYLPDSLITSNVEKAIEYLQQIEDSFNSESGGSQATLLSQLDDIQQYAMTLYYMDLYRDTLNLSSIKSSSSDIRTYSDRFAALVKRFNKTFSKKNTNYTKLKLTWDSNAVVKSDKDFRAALKDITNEQLPKYLGKVLKQVKEGTASLTAEKILSEYGGMLSNVCSFLLNMEDMVDNLTNISPYENETDGLQISFNGKMKIKGAYQEVRKDYADLLEVGSTVLAQKGAADIINIDLKQEFLANMANVTVQDGDVVIPDGVKLSQAYLAILAAGATYTPFSSYAGESSFRAALSSLTDDEDVRRDLLSFYDDTKSFRKPLYRRDINEAGNPTGKATLITVQDFLDDVDAGNEAALVTIAGKFTYDSKNNYWVYADTYSTNQDDDEIESSVSNDEFTDNSNDTISGTTVENDEATDIVNQFNQTNSNDNGSTASTNSRAATMLGSTAQAEWQWEKLDNGTDFCIYAKSSSAETLYQFKTGTSQSSIIVEFMDKAHGKQEYATEKIVVKDGMNYLSQIKAAEDSLGIDENYRLSKFDAVHSQLNKSAECSTDESHVSSDFNAILRAVSKASFQITQNDNTNKASSVQKQQLSSMFLTDTYATAVPGGAGNLDTSISGGTQSTETGSANEGENVTVDPNDPSNASGTGNESTEANSGNTENGTENTESGEGSTTETQTTTSISTSEVSGMSVNSTDVVGIIADKSITSEDKMSEPVLLYGAKHARATDNLTTLLFRNIIKGTIGYESLYNESNDYLYVNAYGDIMTDDGMIILPGIANPIMYNEKAKYNPYSVAFMNYYPTVLEQTNFFQVATQNDIGKMLIMNSAAEFTSDGKLKQDSMVTNKATSITTKNDVKVTSPLSMPSMETKFTYNEVESKELLGYSRLIFGDSSTWNTSNASMFAYTPLIVRAQLESSGLPVFPYNAEDDAILIDESGSNASCACAKIIAQNMYDYLTKDKTGQRLNLEYLNDNYIVYYLCISNLNGSANPLAYANNDVFAYDRQTLDAQLRNESRLFQASEKILSILGGTQQIIGIKTSAQDKILGPLFSVLKERWLMALLLLIVILLFAFARVQRDAFQSIILIVLCSGFAYVFVCVLPVYGPMVYNSVINNVSETLAYKILGVKAETNELNKIDADAVDEAGKFKNQTTSLTLYRVNRDKLKDFYDGLNVTEKDVVGGKSHTISPESGLYVEGDSVKINVDVLFDTLEITGAYSTESGVYQLDARKTVSNSVDYYTPYYALVNNLTGTVNKLAEVYSIPRTVTKYADGQLKDNYFVYSFVNSSPFLTPGNYTVFSPEDQALFNEESLATLLSEQEDTAKKLKDAFGDETTASDWLDITDFFYELDEKYHQTIWAQTMYDNGYYYFDDETGLDWQPDRDKLDDLCNYVNVQTKKFVYDMDDQIGCLSDDVMLKIIALRELTAFTQRVSDLGHWLYPFQMNYQEITLQDTLNCAIVSDYDEFVASDMNICSYVLHQYGWLHLILFDSLVIFLFIISVIIHVAVPLMYLLIGVVVLFKIVKNDDVKVPLKGYIKCALITMMCSTLVSLGVVLTCKLHSSVVCLYFLLFILLFVAMILLTMLFSLITNLADFGNTAINAKITSTANSLNSYRQKVTTANIFSKEHRASTIPRSQTESAIINKYSNDRSVDDYYDDFSNVSPYGYTNMMDVEDELPLEEPEVIRHSSK